MSTTDLPSYPVTPPTFQRTPTYTHEPRAEEQRLAYSDPVRTLRARFDGNFVKQSPKGGVSLRLTQQLDGASLPLYGHGAAVEGFVDLAQIENVDSVEVKIEGCLKMQELAEMGKALHTLCLDKAVLWRKGTSPSCPASLSFSLRLPPTFSDGKDNYPLPPSYECKMTGVPGFYASTTYSVTASVVRSKASLFALGSTAIVSTPFVYLPRTRPAAPLPEPLLMDHTLRGFPDWHPDWAVFKTQLECNVPDRERYIQCKLHVPNTRIFAITESIPFHLSFASRADTMATFQPFAPHISGASASYGGPAELPPAKSREKVRVQLLRRSYCDVRNEGANGAGRDMWRTDTIGEAIFDIAGEGPEWRAYDGHIVISDSVKVAGFKAGGLHVRDYMVLAMTPLDPPRTAKTILREEQKAPFQPLWDAFEVRLTTDPWGKGDEVEARPDYGRGEVHRGAEF
ncbi:hypothetical protein PUNSTDRAFT_130913 [Punctularia strigosozonata HHB-11173 SS5]|uniref:uncharacterized protein n=1 Tax=Punctularia strigosozonata (strain HHB-11173) TaxID=741275 RepID=UPI0004416555|nr:uncharacterized protein PUNSTDRAFT_130913 [Punctularia strigosozonata HHB-11173 SS5]EIN12657.1 hypothetical protein PUNSTDRAFT_130913 [Punctularia strigosozonata HHB-11173 SS5]